MNEEMAQTYRTLGGQVLDLSGLEPGAHRHFEVCYAAWKAGATEESMAMLVGTAANPLVRAAGGRVTKDVYESVGFKAMRDLQHRAAIAHQTERADSDDWLGDPLADEWIPTAEAAKESGVTLPAVHKAIQRGELIARPLREGGTRMAVSRNSLEAWHPNPRRQEAGRARRKTESRV